MPANYVLLEKITVGAANASSVTFSGIPQTGYTDLVVKASVRLAGTGTPGLGIYFNGSTSNFTARSIYGSGSAAFSFSDTRPYIVTANTSSQTANTFTNSEFYVPNYASSNFKTTSADSVMENNATEAYADLAATLWSQTAAITSITVAPSSSSFVQNSTFYLYGVAKLGTTPAIVPYATGGDIIDTDGTYWYHTFLSSGTFTPQKSLSADCLVVAGGAGAAGYNGGGGGAGGLLTFTSQSLTATSYTVTVGAGGAGGDSTSSSAGTNGVDSQFGSLTLVKGGGRSGRANTAGSNGGSGGGAGGAGAFLSGGTATSGQGNNGGASETGGNYPSGGGGGAGSAGSAGSGSTSGAGGNGLANSYSGSSVTYAGGGGGGSTVDGATRGLGGTGGGGNGGASGNAGVAGTANLGGGGGGGAHERSGGNGGSGIVIIRYAV
jgi:hypothetical protein